MQARLTKRLENMDALRKLIEDGSVSEDRWEQVHQMVNNDDIPSAVVDSGATSSCGLKSDPFHHTGEPSHKVFYQPDGQTMAASEQVKLKHEVREPARTVDIVPELKNNSLLS